MDGMTGHDEVAELLGAYVLDAVEPQEVDAIEAHLASCPRCRAEVAGHREVVTLLGDGGGPAPAGVWERLSASLEEPPPPLQLGRIDQPEDAVVRPLRPGRPVPVKWLAGLTAAAAAVIGGLGVEVARLDNRTNHLLADARKASLQAAADAAASHTDARRATLRSADGSLHVDTVILPSGDGYVLDDNLPALPSGQTYQMWGLVGSDRVSLGVLGSRPGVVMFRVEGGMATLAVTAERSPGAATSDKPPVVLASLPS